MTVQSDHFIMTRKPDIVVVEKRNKAIIEDIALPWDHRVNEKESEKVKKYQELKWQIGKLWIIRHVEVVPIVVGALEVISERRIPSDLERHKIMKVFPTTVTMDLPDRLRDFDFPNIEDKDTLKDLFTLICGCNSNCYAASVVDHAVVAAGVVLSIAVVAVFATRANRPTNIP
eukprot:XP_014772641.1 PREDICTED: uncharacterized protein LOC106870919 [Octopus bimaculoides]